MSRKRKLAALAVSLLAVGLLTIPGLAAEQPELEALEYYLRKENSTVQKKMDEALRQLYETSIPDSVREFVGRKSSTLPRPKRPAPKLAASRSAATVGPTGAEVGAVDRDENG